jgi:hypothetical protein
MKVKDPTLSRNARRVGHPDARLEVVAEDHAQLGSGSGIQAGLQFYEHASAVLHAGQNVETRLVVEIAEVDVSSLLKILMNEDERGSGTDVRGPVSAAIRSRKAVRRLQVDGNKIGNFPEGKFRIGAEHDAGMEDRSHLRLNAKQEEFGIKGLTETDSGMPTPGLAPDITLYLAHLGRDRRGLRTFVRSGSFGIEYRNIAGSTSTILVWITRGHTNSGTLYQPGCPHGAAVVGEQMVFVVITSYD